MARTPITDSANIFLQGSQLYQNANSKIFDAINGAADMYAKQQAQKEANLSAERMKQAELDAQKAKMQQEAQKAMFTDEGFQAILAKKQMAPQSVTPEEDAALQAGIQFRQSQMGQNPVTGGLYPKFQPNFGTSPAASMMVPVVSQDMGVSPVAAAMLSPPRMDGSPSTTEQFNDDFKSAPAPIGASEKVIKPTDTTGMGSTPVGKMKTFEKELDFYGKKLEKNLDVELEASAAQKSKSLAQQALDRMNEINNTLNKNGVLVSEKQGIAGNASNMLRNAPYAGGVGEKVLDPKNKALKEEYERLRSVLLPFYAKASGLGSKSLDSEGERKSMLDSFGSMEGTYEGNKAQLENLANMIGTGFKKSDAIKDNIDAKLKAAGYSGAQIEAYKRAKGIK
jgi:hypothetical protein